MLTHITITEKMIEAVAKEAEVDKERAREIVRVVLRNIE